MKFFVGCQIEEILAKTDQLFLQSFSVIFLSLNFLSYTVAQTQWGNGPPSQGHVEGYCYYKVLAPTGPGFNFRHGKQFPDS